VSLVEAAIDRDDLPEMSMLVDERTLKDVMEDFLVASKAADLVADGVLDLRLLGETVDNALFVSPSRVVVLVSTDDRVAALASDDDEFVAEVFETHSDAFADAETYGLRTPRSVASGRRWQPRSARRPARTSTTPCSPRWTPPVAPTARSTK